MLYDTMSASFPSLITPESMRFILLDFIAHRLMPFENVTNEVLAESSSILSSLTQLNMKEEKLVLLEHLGDYYTSKCHYYDAFRHYALALETRHLVFDDPHMIPLIKKIMSICTPIGKFVDALHFANLAFIYMPSMSIQDFYSITFNSALAHSMLTSYDVALKDISILLNKSPYFLKEHPAFHLKLLLLNANCLLYSNRSEDALKTYQTIIDSFDLSIEDYLVVLLNTASLYLTTSRTNELRDLIANLERLLPYYKDISSYDYIIEIYYEVAQLYGNMNALAHSETYYLQALSLSVSSGHALNTSKILSALITLYSSTNNKKGMDALRPSLAKIFPIQSLDYTPIISKMILFYNVIGDTSAITEILETALANMAS